MLPVLQAIKKVIERRVINIQPLAVVANQGATTITVQSAKRFNCGDKIVIYSSGSTTGEIATVVMATDYRTLLLENPLSRAHPVGDNVQVLINDQWFKGGVYIGDPAVIPVFPAITVALGSVSNDWITLNSLGREFRIDISVYTETSFYERNYAYMLKLATDISDTLFKTMYPLVSYKMTTLVEDVSETDTLIKVADSTLLQQFAWFWLENYQFTSHAKPRRYLTDNQTIELVNPIGNAFHVGDDVIFPTRHFYDSRVTEIELGTVVKECTLACSRLSYFAKEEVLIPDPFFLPLNR